MNNQDWTDYNELIKDNIHIAKTLSQIPESKKNKVKNLLIKKKQLYQKNGFLAEFRIEKINKKISKLKEEYNEEKKIN